MKIEYSCAISQTAKRNFSSASFE